MPTTRTAKSTPSSPTPELVTFGRDEWLSVNPDARPSLVSPSRMLYAISDEPRTEMEITILPPPPFTRFGSSQRKNGRAKSALDFLNEAFHTLLDTHGVRVASMAEFNTAVVLDALETHCDALAGDSWRSLGKDLVEMVVIALQRYQDASQNSDVSHPDGEPADIPSTNIPRLRADTLRRSLGPPAPRPRRSARAVSIVPSPSNLGGGNFLVSMLEPRHSVFFPGHVLTLTGTPRAGATPVVEYSKADVGDEEDDGSYTINQHVVLMPLGHGTQGEVVLAMDTVKNELRAIKAVPRPKGIHNNDDQQVTRGALGAAKAARRQQLEREIAIMKHCRHRNLVALHEVIDDPDLDVMYLVMQYVDKGPIAKLRDDWTIEKPIDPVKLAAYTVQLCAGLSYLHRKGVIHRDIKPDNVLIGSRDDVYLADFGTSDIFRGDESRRVLGHRGTAAFMAPELLSDEQDDDDDSATDLQKKGEAVDIWALGITLYVLLYGKLPWTSTTPADLSSEIIDARIPLSREQSSLVPGLLPASANHSPCKYSLLKFEPRDTSTPTPPQSALRDAAYVRPGPITLEDSTVLGNSTAQISISDSHVATSQPSDASLNLSPADKAWARLLGDILRKEPRRRLALAQISVRAQQIIEQHQLAKESSFDPKNESSSMFMSSDAIVLRRVAEEDDDIVVALKIPA